MKQIEITKEKQFGDKNIKVIVRPKNKWIWCYIDDQEVQSDYGTISEMCNLMADALNEAEQMNRTELMEAFSIRRYELLMKYYNYHFKRQTGIDFECISVEFAKEIEQTFGFSIYAFTEDFKELKNKLLGGVIKPKQ